MMSRLSHFTHGLSKLVSANRIFSSSLANRGLVQKTLGASSYSTPTFGDVISTLEPNSNSSSVSAFFRDNITEASVTQDAANNPKIVQETFSHVLNIHVSLNNTILTFCNGENQVMFTTSAGTAGFKKARRAGFESAYQAATQLVEKVENKRIKVTTLLIKFKGFGPGREAAFRAIRANTNWPIRRLLDRTPVPHNGCRPPKPRRL